MSYTPPVYTAVNFDDASTSYTPPVYTAVNFDEVLVAYLTWIMLMASAPQ